MIFYFLFNVLGILVSPLFLRVVWKNWHLPVALPLTVFTSIVFTICLLSLYGMTTGAQGMLFHDQINLLLSFSTAVLWFWVTYEYIKREKIPLTLLGLLSIEPIVVVIIVLSNDSLSLDGMEGLSIAQMIELKPILMVRLIHTFYALGLVIWSLAWLAWYLLQNSAMSLLNLVLLILVLCLPTVSLLLYVSGVISVRVGAPLSVVLVVLGVSRFKLLDVVPIARDKIVEQLKEGVATLNRKGLIVDANRFACNLLALPYHNDKQQLRPVVCPEIITQNFSLENIKVQKREIHFLNNSDEVFLVNTQLLPLLDKQQEIVGHLLILRDITLQKESEREREYHIDQLEKSRQQLEVLDQLKSNFLTNISHEFRTPLTLSLGPINDVLDGRFGDVSLEVRQQLNSVNKHNRRLLELINQLLELSRLESVGDIDVEKVNESIEVIDVMPVIIDSFNGVAQKKQVEITLSHDLDEANIQMKLSDFEKIMHNLLSNALKSIDQDGVITVDVTETDVNTIEISVKDTGCGIDVELLPHIFERFYYSEHQHTQWSASTGIGLALVKQLIESHGGDILVKSEYGIGSIFVVKLPKSALPLVSPKTKSVSIEPVVEQDKNVIVNKSQKPDGSNAALVLVVEDNKDMCEYILSHLSDDYRLLTATNGDDGLLLAQEQVPDLIISDIMMPGINGVDLCKAIKSDIKTSHIPLILLSAKAEIKDKLEGLAVEANDYLTKPFDSTELKLRVDNLISQQIKSREHYRQIFVADTEKISSEKPVENGREEGFLKNVQQKMTAHISQSEIKMSDLAASLFITERQLQRKLRSLTGKSPTQLMLEARLSHAKNLLQETSMNVTAIVEESGFNSSSYFSKKFKLIYGQSPTEYRKSLL